MESANGQTSLNQGHQEDSGERDVLIKSTHHSDTYNALGKTETDVFDTGSSFQKKSEQELHKPTKETQEDLRQNVPNYSVTRARLVSCLILVFYVIGPTSMASILSQYLDHRWMDEAKINKSLAANRSVCFRNDSDPMFKQQDDIQARVSIETMYYSYTTSIPAIFSSLVLGSYSDVIGRRMLFFVPVLGSLARLLVCFAVIRFNLNINFFYLGQAIDGIGGSVFAVLIASFSISADVSVGKSSRIIWIVVLHVSSEVIISSTSIVSGYLVDTFGFSVALIFLICPTILALILIIFLLPETGPKTRPKCHQKQNVCTNVVRVVRIYTSEGNYRDRMSLFLCLVLFFLVAFNILTITSIDTLYQMHEPFCWDATFIGYYSAARNAGQAVLGAVVLKISQFCGCIKDEKLAMIGSLFKAGSSVLEAFVRETWSFFMVPLVGFPSFLAIGIIRGVMSILVGPFNQGAMFASVAFIETLSNIVSSTVLNRVYAATVSVLPGAVYLVMAGVAVFTFLIYFIFFYFYDEPTKDYALLIPEPKEETISEDRGIQNNEKYP